MDKIITIDGPSGVGKGTLAMSLAKKLQWNYLNSGSLYRTLAYLADEKEIEITIRSGGLSKSKAPRIKKVLNEIRAEVGSFDLSFLSEMPIKNAKEWLMKFNGIGPKTAAIILCFSFQMPAMPVDTHIFRVSKRLGLIGKKITAEKAHDLLERVVPSAEVFQFHMFLIRHGRDTCKARRPSCDVCVLSHICPSFGRI